MPRILIFNATSLAAEARLKKNGSQTYETLIKASLDQHIPGDQSIDYFMLRVAEGERFPQGLGLSDFDGVWISGSPLNVYKLDQPSVREQIELTRQIWESGVPSFGSCWGLQLMTAALGGTVHLNPNGREIGIARRIALNEAGRAHDMYRGKGPAFDALCTHEDEVASLPSCATVLASNAVSRVQAAVMVDGISSFWGVQYHPEFVFATIAAIISGRPERLIEEGRARSHDEVAAVVADYRALGAEQDPTPLAWKYGVGPDILDPTLRTAEFRNWLHTQVLPYAARK